MHIAKGNGAKTIYVTKCKVFEFMVMSFGLSSTLMNKLYNEYLDKFVIVYLDNIVIYIQAVVYIQAVEKYVRYL